MLFICISSHVFGEKKKYVANLAEGKNKWVWYEDDVGIHRLDPYSDRSVYLRVDLSSIFLRILSKTGTIEQSYKIVSVYEEDIIAERVTDRGVSILQISPSKAELKMIAIEDSGYLVVERYELGNVPGVD